VTVNERIVTTTAHKKKVAARYFSLLSQCNLETYVALGFEAAILEMERRKKIGAWIVTQPDPRSR